MVKTSQEIKKIKESCLIVREAKKKLRENIKAGITLKQLDRIAYDFIKSKHAKPSFLGYNDFPASICTSVNDVLIHGIPTDYTLRDGDVISIDIGVYKDGFHGDSAFTMAVGKIDVVVEKLIKTSQECLKLGLMAIKDGVTLGQVGRAIEQHAKKNGFYLVKNFSGHGVGASLHEEPQVFNFENSPTKNYVLRAGEVIAIEPMLLIGDSDVFIDPIDKWSVRSKLGKKTAHEEHTILVTKDGCEILT